MHVSYPCHPITTRVRTETATNVFGREQQLRNEVETEAEEKNKAEEKIEISSSFSLHISSHKPIVCALLSHMPLIIVDRVRTNPASMFWGLILLCSQFPTGL